jgi:hypothetical protein
MQNNTASAAGVCGRQKVSTAADCSTYQQASEKYRESNRAFSYRLFGVLIVSNEVVKQVKRVFPSDSAGIGSAPTADTANTRQRRSWQLMMHMAFHPTAC